MSELFPPNIADQIACIEREIAMRLRVYPRQIAAGRMSEAKAEREITTMRAALETLKAVQIIEGKTDGTE